MFRPYDKSLLVSLYNAAVLNTVGEARQAQQLIDNLQTGINSYTPSVALMRKWIDAPNRHDWLVEWYGPENEPKPQTPQDYTLPPYTRLELATWRNKEMPEFSRFFCWITQAIDIADYFQTLRVWGGGDPITYIHLLKLVELTRISIAPTYTDPDGKQWPMKGYLAEPVAGYVEAVKQFYNIAQAYFADRAFDNLEFSYLLDSELLRNKVLAATANVNDILASVYTPITIPVTPVVAGTEYGTERTELTDMLRYYVKDSNFRYTLNLNLNDDNPIVNIGGTLYTPAKAILTLIEQAKNDAFQNTMIVLAGVLANSEDPTYEVPDKIRKWAADIRNNPLLLVHWKKDAQGNDLIPRQFDYIEDTTNTSSTGYDNLPEIPDEDKTTVERGADLLPRLQPRINLIGGVKSYRYDTPTEKKSSLLPLLIAAAALYLTSKQ